MHAGHHAITGQQFSKFVSKRQMGVCMQQRSAVSRPVMRIWAWPHGYHSRARHIALLAARWVCQLAWQDNTCAAHTPSAYAEQVVVIITITVHAEHDAMLFMQATPEGSAAAQPDSAQRPHKASGGHWHFAR